MHILIRVILFQECILSRDFANTSCLLWLTIVEDSALTLQVENVHTYMYIQHIATHVLNVFVSGYTFTCPYTCTYFVHSTESCTSIEGVVWSPDSLREADLSPDMNNCVYVKTVWE